MSRIRKAYEARFRRLLGQLGTRRVDQGVQWLLAKAEQLGVHEGIPPANALTRVHMWLLRRIGAWLNRTDSTQPATVPAATPAVRSHLQQTTASVIMNRNAPSPRPSPPLGAGERVPEGRVRGATREVMFQGKLFLCDAGLGGLARWLRAAGYEAVWIPDIEDAELLREARRREAMILTTDSMLMERRLLRDGVIPALWLPPTLTMLEQLALVFRELGLSARDPRCMSCGGELRRVEKEAMRKRIPPKTWRWVDEYFLCARCDKLFWHGTHWQRIQTRLRQLDDGPTTAKP